MLNLMYHYVFPLRQKKKLNGINFTSQEEFKSQLLKIKDKYEILDPEDLINSDINYLKKKKNLCSISFDDGTKDQFKYALPVLNDLKIKVFFFIIGSVLNYSIPNTHLLHYLMNFQSEKIILNKLINKFYKNKFNYNDLFSESKIYSYEKNFEKRILKYLINFKLQNHYNDLKNFLIFEINKFTQIEKMNREWFADKVDISNAINEGHYIGNHSFSHFSYENNSIDNLKKDLNKCHDILKKNFNFEAKAYCHPQGGDEGFVNNEISKYLKTMNYKVCFNATNNSKKIDKMNLPRLDNIYYNE